MKSTDSLGVLEVGVDYITATNHERSANSDFYSFGRWLVAKEVACGSRRNSYRAQGYRGYAAGRAAIGISHQGTIIRISAGLAREHWAQCFSLSHNVTRLDVQATVRPPDSPSERIGSHYSQMKRARRFRGKRATYTMRNGPDGPESCSLGNRLSDRYGRIYDKGKESGAEEYQGAVRYELELHRAPALRAASILDTTDLDHAVIVDLLYRFFSVRGCVVPELKELCEDRPFACARLSSSALPDVRRTRAPDIIRAIRFMRDQVKPGVQRLVAAGELDLVLRELGLSDYVQVVADNSNADDSADTRCGRP